MNSLPERLNCRVDAYRKIKTVNELNEIDYKHGKIKALWAEITPQNGSEKSGQANTVSTEISCKFVIRDKALPELSNDMYFIFKGQKYNVKYWLPNYRYRDKVDIFCSLVVEQ